MQKFKQLLASHIERSEKIDDMILRVKHLENESEKIDDMILRVKDLEDELKIVQSDLDGAAMNSKQIKEELTKQCKEHHETIKHYLERESFINVTMK